MLRRASLTAIALAALALAACGSAILPNSNGGGGGSSSTTTGSGSSSTTAGSGGNGTTTGSGGGCTYNGTHHPTGDTFTATDGCNTCTCDASGQAQCAQTGCVATCVSAGGTCAAITPGFCADGVIGDASQYSCGTGVGVGCCLHAKDCSGKPCTTEGATRCSGGLMQVCGINPKTNCALEWLSQDVCPDGQVCNSDGTKCVARVAQCAQASECTCGCTCTPQGECGYCAGGIPGTCVADADCGASCAGFHCVAGKCVGPVCVPGEDQTCNEVLTMSSFAGTCNADRTCTCNAGFSKKADGKCGP